MVEVIHTAYVSLDVNDPRYRKNPSLVRADVLKALSVMSRTHNRLFPTDEQEPSVTVYKSKDRVFIKYRTPINYNGVDTIYGILRKDEIYETVLGMVMDGREEG